MIDGMNWSEFDRRGCFILRQSGSTKGDDGEVNSIRGFDVEYTEALDGITQPRPCRTIKRRNGTLVRVIIVDH